MALPCSKDFQVSVSWIFTAVANMLHGTEYGFLPERLHFHSNKIDTKITMVAVSSQPLYKSQCVSYDKSVKMPV